MFRRLAPQGGSPREISEVVNGILNGKTNNTGTVTLATGGATTTTLADERISPDSKIILLPSSAAAFADTAPYGQFINSSDQLAPSAGSTAVVAWDTVISASGISIGDTSRITVTSDGTYAAFVSLQLQNVNNDAQYADVWFRVNGTDVANSGRRFFLPARKSATEPSHVVGIVSAYLDLDINDYIEVAGSVSSVDVTLENFAADALIPRPAIPSAAVKIEYIAPLAYSNVYVSAQGFGQATITHWANTTADKAYSYVIIG